MTDLVSRQAEHPTAAVPALSPTGGLPDKLQLANALSKAGPDMLPKAYVGNVGACLLAIDYADRMDLALFEVTAEVSFTRGRPTVGARLQKKLAARQGYRTQLVEGDAESCTVALFDRTGVEVGRTTYTYATAEALGIIYQNGTTLKSTWAGDPAQMLFHRATTRVLDHYGPGEFAGAFVDEYTEPDVLDIIDGEHPPDVSVRADHFEEPIDSPPAPPADAPDTSAVENRPSPEPVTWNAYTGDELRARINEHQSRNVTIPKATRALAKRFPDVSLATMYEVAEHPEALAFLLEWIDANGVWADD